MIIWGTGRPQMISDNTGVGFDCRYDEREHLTQTTAGTFVHRSLDVCLSSQVRSASCYAPVIHCLLRGRYPPCVVPYVRQIRYSTYSIGRFDKREVTNRVHAYCTGRSTKKRRAPRVNLLGKLLSKFLQYPRPSTTIP